MLREQMEVLPPLQVVKPFHMTFSANSSASIHTAPDVGISEALPMLIL
jgi:hypothetical protein